VTSSTSTPVVLLLRLARDRRAEALCNERVDGSCPDVGPHVDEEPTGDRVITGQDLDHPHGAAQDSELGASLLYE